MGAVRSVWLVSSALMVICLAAGAPAPVLAPPPAPVLAPAPETLPPAPKVLPTALEPAAGPVPTPPSRVPRPRIALVLGGGAARGFAHIGVIRELERARIPIDLVVGSSAGSLIGAIYASNLNSFYLERTAAQLKEADICDFGLLSAVAGMGLARGDRLERWVRAHVRTTNIEHLKLPFAAVATDLNWGREVVLDRGSVARAVRASSAIPGVFQPVAFQGRMLVDGGVVDSLPVAVARARGADLVIAVDVGSKVGNTRISNLVDVALQAANIMSALNVEGSRRSADVLIRPRVGDVGMLDFTQRGRCMRAGSVAARLAMPRIRARIAAWGAAHAVHPGPPSGPLPGAPPEDPVAAP